MPYDTPIPGYGTGTVNTLRLWGARASQEFDSSEFNSGDYIRAIEARAQSENICRVLYPNDNSSLGKELRLTQEYFFVSATLQDILRRYRKRYEMVDRPQGLRPFDRFADKVAIQLNDTHPALAIPELMRLLVDRRGAPWDEAWAITPATFGYTNHTLLPEALERWPVRPVRAPCCRATRRSSTRSTAASSTSSAARFGADDARSRRMSIIEEGDEQRVRMAHLAIVGSHAVNGVAELHTEILKTPASSTTSTSSAPSGSPTRRTASPRAAGSCKSNPRLSAAHHRRDRHRLGHTTSTS